jgi:Preprotein translocase subunit SecD
MNQYPIWKNALIVFFLFISALYALPNIYGSDLAIQISGTGDYVVQDQDVKNIKNSLETNEIDYKSMGIDDRRIMIRFEDSQSQLSSKTLLKNTLSRNYVVALNLAPSIPQWLSNVGGKAMSLGLDLRGGVHFLLEVDMEAVVSIAIDRYYNELRAVLREDRLYKSIRKEDNLLVVSFKTENLKTEAKKLIKDKLSDLNIVEGSETDLQLSLEISSDAQSAAKSSALKQNITTLRNRVNELVLQSRYPTASSERM